MALTGLAGSDVSGGLPPGTQVPLIFGNPATNSAAFLLDQIRAIQLAQGLPVATSPLVEAETSSLNSRLIGGYGQNLRNLISGECV